jgi:hypothetical protein
MFGVTLDESVNFHGPIGGDPEKILGKTLHSGAYVLALIPEDAAHIIRSLFAHVGLKEHLQHEFARFAASSHLAFSHQRSALSLQDKSFGAFGSKG